MMSNIHSFTTIDPAQDCRTRSDAGRNFEAVPQLQVLHKQEKDVERFYQVDFEYLEYCESFIQSRGEEIRATFPMGIPKCIAPGIM